MRLAPQFAGRGLSLFAVSGPVTNTPSLRMFKTWDSTLLSWPGSVTGYRLISATNLLTTTGPGGGHLDLSN